MSRLTKIVILSAAAGITISIVSTELELSWWAELAACAAAGFAIPSLIKEEGEG